jgi:Mor family transcriptional regulator
MIETTKSPKAEQQQGNVFAGQSYPTKEKSADFVTALLNLLCDAGLMLPDQRTDADKAVRGYFGRDRYYVAQNSAQEDAQTKARAVLAMFNGRNAREVARRLGIGKTTVYRIIKQSGGRRV